MKTRYILLLLFFGIALQAQDLPKIVPPTPEAASLMKFVETPVSHYNGTPNINIPIYNVNSSGVSVPVSLSYNAKGIAVNEMASRVGLGWALNAGGMITRQIRGKADEFLLGYLTTDYTDKFFTADSLSAIAVVTDANNYDTDPDLYFFKFMGYSGKFIFDHVTKKPVLQTADDIKIDFGFTGSFKLVDYFILTDPKGVKYYFGKSKDGTRTAKDYIHGMASDRFIDAISGGWENIEDPEYSNATNGWCLMEIETPDKASIKFYYDNSEQVFYCTRDKDEKVDSGAASCYFSRVDAFQCQLERIEFDEGDIYFNKDLVNEREDLNGGRTLESIVVKDKADNQKKKFEFEYYYTTAVDDDNQIVSLEILEPEAKKRLFLSKVYEVDNAASSPVKLPYVFEYNPILLPHRHSNMIDNWGFYNGKPNGEFLANQTSDRKVDFTKSAAGILTKITYPTGGSTDFVYEHNEVIPPDFFRELLRSPNNQTHTKHFGALKNPAKWVSGNYRYEYDNLIIANYPRTVNVDVMFNTTGCSLPYDGPGCRYDFFICNANGGILYKILYGQSTVWLPAGEYKIFVDPTGEHDPNAPFDENGTEDFWVHIDWTEEIIDSNELLYVGGKRIKEIISDDANGHQLKKEYEYVNTDGKSSGRIFSIPPFYHIFLRLPGGFVGANGQILNMNNPVGDFNGSDVGYSRVIEKSIGSDENFKTEYTFTDFYDTGEYYKFPYHQANDLGWTRGNPLTVKQYKAVGGHYYLVREEQKKYVYFNASASPIYGTEEFDLSELVDPGAPPVTFEHYFRSHRINRIPLFRAGSYYNVFLDPFPDPSSTYRIAYFIGGRLNVKETKQTSYFYNDLNVETGSIVKTTNFVYDSPVHHQLTSENTTDSKGAVIKTNYYYTPDTAMVAEPEATVLSDATHHRIELLKTEVLRNDVKLSEQKTVYKDWTGGLIAPELIKTSKGAAGLETRIRYNKMDTDNGNPLEVQQENGMKTCYIWGYNKTKPVAKIENIAYVAIPTELIEDIEDAANDTVLEGAFSALRTDPALAGAMVTTYTYDPLIGVTSVTDPKGDRITYEYDLFGRLKAIKDKDGNLLSEHEYHYANQN